MDDGLEGLSRLLSPEGLQAVHLPEPAQARTVLGSLDLRAALVDLTCAERLEETLEVLDLLARRSPRVPVPARVRPGATTERYEASRRGADALVEPDASPGDLLQAVETARERSRIQPRRVLVVDDDPAFLEVARGLLEPEGLLVDTLEDPTEFWSRLESGRPDLAVLGLEMGGLSGLTLCRLVRQDLRWSALPVLLVTSDTSAGSLEHVFASGADDYVGRALAAQELAPRVRSRLGRARHPERPKARVQALLELASRAGVPVTLAAVRTPRPLKEHLASAETPVPLSPLEWLVPFFGRGEEEASRLLQDAGLPPALVEFPRDGRSLDELTRTAHLRLLEGELGAPPASGLDVLRSDTRPRLVILDVELPGISGFEVLRRLERRGPRVLRSRAAAPSWSRSPRSARAPGTSSPSRSAWGSWPGGSGSWTGPSPGWGIAAGGGACRPCGCWASWQSRRSGRWGSWPTPTSWCVTRRCAS